MLLPSGCGRVVQATEVQQAPETRHARPPRRTLVAASLRAAATVVAVVTVYYALPLNGRLSSSAGAVLAVGVLGFVLVGIRQVRSILHAPYPAVRGVQVLA